MEEKKRNNEENDLLNEVNNKTSIRDIKISKKREHIDSYSNESEDFTKDNFPPQSTSSYKEKNKKKWPKIITIVLIFLIIFSAISIFFHSANVEITPKYEEIVFAKENIYQATASIQEEGTEQAPNLIQYELANFSFSLQEEMDSIGVEERENKATGKIKIINNSNETQKLLKETRFRNENKIFMTYKSVTVPANSSIIADAFATEAGQEYNLSQGVKFDIPGFEEVNSPLFTKMSGEVAESFTGGLIGKNNIPDKNDLKLARETSQDKLEVMADSEIVDKIKEGYLLVDSRSFREFSEKMSSQENKVILTTTLNVQTILFKESNFLQMILNLDEQDEDLKIKDITSLKFDILSENLSIDAADDFNFNLQGNIKIYRKFDEESFLIMIKGDSKDEVNKKIENNFEHFDIDIALRPFWRSSIPNNEEKIKIKVNN